MTLFKFCTATGGAKILETRSIFITSPLDLNDPFEMRPAWTDVHSKRHRDDQELRNKMFMPLESEATSVPVGNQLGIADMHNQGVFTELHQRYRVLCFSTGMLDSDRSHDVSEKDILMWAHYADSFQGVCIGVDPEKFANGIKPGGMRVDYLSSRVQLPPSFYDVYQNIAAERVEADGIVFTKDPEKGIFLMDHNRKEIIDQQFISLLSHKSPAWRYEQETRMIYELEAVKKSPNYLRPNFPCSSCQQQKKTAEMCAHQTYRDAIRLPAEAITSVILGSDISRHDTSVVLKLLDTPDFEHVKVYWCSLHSDQYTLQYNEDRTLSTGRYSLFMQELREREIAEAKGHVRFAEGRMTYTPGKKTILYESS